MVVIFMWGPSKIPEFAKAIGRARKELDTARKEIENPTDALLQPASQSQAKPAPLSADDLLIQTAKRMGITTEGKTREQITNEMISKSAPSNQNTTTK